MRDDLGFLRKFVDNIKNDPVHFPPSVPSHQHAPDAHILDGLTHPLSKNFVQGVYNRSIFSQHDCDPTHLPIVVVTNVQQKHMNISLRDQSNREKRFTMHVADGDSNILTIKGAFQLVRGGSEFGALCFTCSFCPQNEQVYSN